MLIMVGVTVSARRTTKSLDYANKKLQEFLDGYIVKIEGENCDGE